LLQHKGLGAGSIAAVMCGLGCISVQKIKLQEIATMSRLSDFQKKVEAGNVRTGPEGQRINLRFGVNTTAAEVVRPICPLSLSYFHM
jgi:hypothetical protein